LAPAGYWRDAFNEKYFQQYLKYSSYLAPINNEREHAKSAEYKERFGALNRFELVKFQNDSVIYPNESSWFGTYDVGQTVVTKMRDTLVYKNDTVGLKELDEQDKLYFRLVPNADHIQFGDKQILNEFIPFLY
jgi:palmitoyl-protein thioesterase